MFYIVYLSIVGAFIICCVYFLAHLFRCSNICREERQKACEYCDEQLAAGTTSYAKINATFAGVPDLARMTPRYFYVWDKEKLRNIQ